MIIYGDKVKLTGLELEDQQFLNDLINDPEIEHMTAGECSPVSRYSQNSWSQKHGNGSDPCRSTIREKESNSIVGLIYIDNIDGKNRRCQTGIKLATKYRGKGYATDAVISLMSFLFNEMNMHRVESIILEYNIPSQKLYKKCGFELEGILRKAVYKSGAYRNQLLFALLREVFFERFPAEGHV